MAGIDFGNLDAGQCFLTDVELPTHSPKRALSRASASFQGMAFLGWFSMPPLHCQPGGLPEICRGQIRAAPGTRPKNNPHWAAERGERSSSGQFLQAFNRHILNVSRKEGLELEVGHSQRNAPSQASASPCWSARKSDLSTRRSLAQSRANRKPGGCRIKKRLSET